MRVLIVGLGSIGTRNFKILKSFKNIDDIEFKDLP